jgi:hypothetical protein
LKIFKKVLTNIKQYVIIIKKVREIKNSKNFQKKLLTSTRKYDIINTENNKRITNEIENLLEIFKKCLTKAIKNVIITM